MSSAIHTTNTFTCTAALLYHSLFMPDTTTSYLLPFLFFSHVLLHYIQFHLYISLLSLYYLFSLYPNSPTCWSTTCPLIFYFIYLFIFLGAGRHGFSLNGLDRSSDLSFSFSFSFSFLPLSSAGTGLSIPLFSFHHTVGFCITFITFIVLPFAALTGWTPFSSTLEFYRSTYHRWMDLHLYLTLCRSTLSGSFHTGYFYTISSSSHRSTYLDSFHTFLHQNFTQRTGMATFCTSFSSVLNLNVQLYRIHTGFHRFTVFTYT